MKQDEENIGFLEEKIRNTFNYLLYSRSLRSIALIYSSLAFSLYLHALHLSLEYIGLTAALVILINIILSLFYGFVGDRKGFKFELILAEIITALGLLIVGISNSLDFIILGMLLAGLSGGVGSMRGAFSPGSSAFIANNFRDEKERIRRFAAVSLIASVSAIGGSLLFTSVSFLSKIFGTLLAYRILFLISFLLLFVSILFLLKLEERPKAKKKSMVINRKSWNYLRKIIIINTFNGAGIGLVVPLLPLWFQLMYHINSENIGLLFTISYITTALGLYLSMKYSFRFESLKIATITRVLSGAMVIALAFSPIFIIAAIIYIARSIISGFGNPSRTNVNIRGISDEDYGTASSIQGIATRVSQLSSGASGYLMDLFIPMPLFIGGVLQMSAGLGYKFLFKQK